MTHTEAMTTITNTLKIHHKGNKVLLAQCLITGKFVSHLVAKTELMLLQIERYKTMLVLFLCVLANVVGIAYLGAS